MILLQYFYIAVHNYGLCWNAFVMLFADAYMFMENKWNKLKLKHLPSWRMHTLDCWPWFVNSTVWLWPWAAWNSIKSCSKFAGKLILRQGKNALDRVIFKWKCMQFINELSDPKIGLHNFTCCYWRNKNIKHSVILIIYFYLRPALDVAMSVRLSIHCEQVAFPHNNFVTNRPLEAHKI